MLKVPTDHGDNRKDHAGFTLLEMAIVVAIIAAVVAGTLSMGSSMVGSAQRVNTNNKLDAIEKALMAYRIANNRLPCPADPTVTDIPANSTTYGYEQGTAGTCGGGATVSYTVPHPSSNTNIVDIGTVVEGALPVRTLGLPDEYQFDGWGRKTSYAVWTPLTAKATSVSSPAAFLNYGITPSCGAITVQNAGGGNRSIAAAYALISYGPNGHGGFLKNGAQYFMGSDNLAEQTNCHCTATGANNAAYNATYVQQEPTQTSSSDSLSAFDDIVRYKERWQMQDAYDTYVPTGMSCSPGFVINGMSADDQTGAVLAVGDINGDGIPDLIISAPNAAPNGGVQNGKVYVVFGTRSGFPNPLPLSTLNGTNGFELDGIQSWSDELTPAVADVNGDGVADLIMGSGYGRSVYVVFGGATRKDGTPWSSCPCTLNTTFLNGTNGATFTNPGEFGNSVAAADINGDGIADIIVGAPYTTVGGNAAAGSVYIIFGQTSGWASSTTISSGTAPIDGTHGIEYDGAAASYSLGGGSCTDCGTNSLATGDVNGDGVADLVILDYNAGSAGAMYVIFGNKKGLLPSTTVSTTSGSPSATVASAAGLIVGETVYSANIPAGTTISAISGTTITLSANATATASGTALNVASVLLNSSFLNGANGSEFDAPLVSYQGFDLFFAVGDLNGDGIADIAVSVGDAADESPMAVFFGKTTGWPATPQAINDSGSSPYINGINAVEFLRPFATNNHSTIAVAIGDINGDGVNDLIMGDYLNFYGSSDTETTFAVFGGTAQTPPATTISTTNTSTSATIGSHTNLVVGDMLYSANIPGGTTITACGGGTNCTSNSITLSNAATATAVGTPVTVSGMMILSGYFPIDGTHGAEFDGPAGSYAGNYVATGDINGDGIGDLFIAAYNNTVSGSNVGSVYVYFGKKVNWPTSPFSLSGL